MNSSGLRRRLANHGFGLLLLPWLPTALGCLFLKYDILRKGGFHEAALGLHVTGLTLRSKVFLFRPDCLYVFVLVPALLCCLGYFLRPVPRMIVTLLISVALHTLLFIEAIVYEATGTFSSLGVIWDAALWALKNRSDTLNPISGAHLAELCLWTAMLAALTFVAFLNIGVVRHRLNRASLAFFMILASATGLAFAVHMPRAAWDFPLMEVELPNAFTATTAVDRGMWLHQPPELMRLYRRTANVPEPGKSNLFSAARGYNVILFVMEAIPAEVFDPARDPLADMPNVKALRQQAFVGSKHYTTFPLTNRAAFSIFTSLYTKCPAGCTGGEQQPPVSNLVSNLRESGYQTAYYGYVWKTSGERDDRMLTTLGFEKIVEPVVDPADDHEGLRTFMGPIEYAERQDREVLMRLRGDVRAWSSNRQPFFAAFFPELSHDPWRSFAGNSSAAIKDRGHALAVYEDKWIGEVMHELKTSGVLDRTIIILTADHGLRFRSKEEQKNSATVAHGKLDDLMLRVPLLVYVPKVLNHTVELQGPTSHIDVAPTVLDLLGVEAHREFEQGTVMWKPEIANRRLYLPMDTFGASGYFERGSFYMKSTMKTVFKSSRMQFSDSDALPWSSDEAMKTIEVIETQDSLQGALLAHLNLCPKPMARIPQAD